MKFDILNKGLEAVVGTLKIGKRFFMKNKPRIFMTSGIVLSAAGTVVACKQTYEHIDRILDDSRYNMEEAEAAENPGKEKLKVMAKTCGEFAKTYAIPAALCTVGYGSIIYANHVQEQRQAILSESLTTLGAAYAAYRKRVEEKLGKEEEEKIRLGVKEADIFTDDGKKQKKEKVEFVEKDEALLSSPFAKFFDESSECWKGEPEYDATFLKVAQFELNNELRSNGYLLLSRVYERIGFKPTKASLVAGWIYGDDEVSDQYVDFGLDNEKSRATRRFVNGLEDVVLLDFNCCSNISDYI